jgi:hypothetical protein
MLCMRCFNVVECIVLFDGLVSRHPVAGARQVPGWQHVGHFMSNVCCLGRERQPQELTTRLHIGAPDMWRHESR